MATKIEITSGSLLIGNPIMVSVIADVLSNATFHRVKLIVKAALSPDFIEEEYPLSAPANSNEVVEFDISTSLRSVAAKYEYNHVTGNKIYPFLSYTLEAYDEYMLNGIPYETGRMIYNNGVKSYALMGAFTARERYITSEEKKAVTTFTRKPNYGEICALGELFVCPRRITVPLTMTSVLEIGQHTLATSLTGIGAQTYEGRTIYVDPNAKNRMLFQFVNGYGVVETISAEMLEEVGSSGETEVDVVTAPSSFNKPRAEVARRSDRRTVYKCSSGYVNKEWAEWWVTEFLGGDAFRRSGHSQCWVFLGGNWLPCTVVPDDDITLYDRSKPGLIHVDFEVRVL